MPDKESQVAAILTLCITTDNVQGGAVGPLPGYHEVWVWSQRSVHAAIITLILHMYLLDSEG